MIRPALAPLVVIGLFLLPSCSNEKEEACKSAEISRENYNLKAGALQEEASQYWESDYPAKGWKLEQEAKETYKLSLRVILNNQECFTNEQVAEAQRYLEDPANK